MKKTIEKPLYQHKTTIESLIYEVSRPGQNSFLWYLGRDGTVFCGISAGTEQFLKGMSAGTEQFICTFWENAFLGPKYVICLAPTPIYVQKA